MCTGRLLYDSAVPSSTTEIEYDHSPSGRIFSGLQTAPGLCYTVIGCDFPKPCYFEFASLSGSPPHGFTGREDGAQLKNHKHTHKPLHISSLLYDLMGSVTLEIFDIGAASPQGHWFTGLLLEVSPAKIPPPNKRYQGYCGD